MFPNTGSANLMFSIIPVLIFCVFAVIIITFIVNGIKGISQWQSNNNQPVLIVPAKLISKITNVSSTMHTDSDAFTHNHTTTSYYITFEVESKSRMEFKVTGKEYGLLVEGDIGKLQFQGTRYLGFERTS